MNRNRIRRCSYWGTWNLVLTERFAVGSRAAGAARAARGERPRPTGFRTVEVNLSPVNGWDRCGAAEIARMQGIVIRTHCTAPDARDAFVDELPLDAQVALAAHIGWDAAAWLLDPATEILGIVDWDAHARLSNGGARLTDCVKPQFAHLVPRIVASEATRTIHDGIRSGELRIAA